MRSLLLTLAILLTALSAAGQSVHPALSSAQRESIPNWALKTYGASGLHKQIEIFAAGINPFYQRGDFNGDGKEDLAVVVRDRKSGKVGIAFIHRNSDDIILVGAGIPMSDGGDDFRWMDAWYVYDRDSVPQSVVTQDPPPILRGDALEVIKSESASGLLWWDGTKYQWYPRGD